MSMDELIEELRKINQKLAEIQEVFEKRESMKMDYNIIMIFAGFIPIFLFLISYFQTNPGHFTEYFLTLAFFVFFACTSFIWAIIQIAKAETPFTYSLTLLMPLFIVFLPLLWAILIILHILPTTTVFEGIANITIIIYAIIVFVYLAIELLYRNLIAKTK
jgi:hypothetical protein